MEKDFINSHSNIATDKDDFLYAISSKLKTIENEFYNGQYNFGMKNLKNLINDKEYSREEKLMLERVFFLPNNSVVEVYYNDNNFEIEERSEKQNDYYIAQVGRLQSLINGDRKDMEILSIYYPLAKRYLSRSGFSLINIDEKSVYSSIKCEPILDNSQKNGLCLNDSDLFIPEGVYKKKDIDLKSDLLNNLVNEDVFNDYSNNSTSQNFNEEIFNSESLFQKNVKEVNEFESILNGQILGSDLLNIENDFSKNLQSNIFSDVELSGKNSVGSLDLNNVLKEEELESVFNPIEEDFKSEIISNNVREENNTIKEYDKVNDIKLDLNNINLDEENDIDKSSELNIDLKFDLTDNIISDNNTESDTVDGLDNKKYLADLDKNQIIENQVVERVVENNKLYNMLDDKNINVDVVAKNAEEVIVKNTEDVVATIKNGDSIDEMATDKNNIKESQNTVNNNKASQSAIIKDDAVIKDDIIIKDNAIIKEEIILDNNNLINHSSKNVENDIELFDKYDVSKKRDKIAVTSNIFWYLQNSTLAQSFYPEELMVGGNDLTSFVDAAVVSKLFEYASHTVSVEDTRNSLNGSKLSYVQNARSRLLDELFNESQSNYSMFIKGVLLKNVAYSNESEFVELVDDILGAKSVKENLLKGRVCLSDIIEKNDSKSAKLLVDKFSENTNISAKEIIEQKKAENSIYLIKKN